MTFGSLITPQGYKTEDSSPDRDSAEEFVRQHILVYAFFSSFCQGYIMS